MTSDVENGKATPTPEQLAEADKIKEEANFFFKSESLGSQSINLVFYTINANNKLPTFFSSSTDKEYNRAIELYTKAIELDPTNAVFFANRSLAHLRQESFGYALNDAVSSLKADPAYLKAYYRRAGKVAYHAHSMTFLLSRIRLSF